MTIGSIIGLGIFLVLLIYKGLIKFSIKNTFVVFSLLLVVSLTPLSNKFHLYVVNISELIQQNNINSSNIDNSIKERVFFLNTALNIINKNQFTGIGFNKFEAIVENNIKERNLIIEARDHPHNDFLDLGVKMGLAGIISLLAFYLLLYKFFSKRLDGNKSYFCVSGLSVLTSQFGYMMTQTQFTHHQAIAFFIVLLLFFASQSKLLEH
jgi:O-antigen ligase